MTTRARARQKRVERKIYNAAERAKRAKQYYDQVRKAKSAGKV